MVRRYVGRPARETPCGYCSERWATGYDHLLPLAAGGSNARSNLFPSCGRCNSWLAALVFPSLDEKRAYIAARLAGRPYIPSPPAEGPRGRPGVPRRTPTRPPPPPAAGGGGGGGRPGVPARAARAPPGAGDPDHRCRAPIGPAGESEP